MKSYAEKLQDPRWQRKRLKVLERDEFKCQLCYDDKTMLVAHHKYYKKGKDPWEYPMKALITLCDTCHKKISKKAPQKDVAGEKRVLEVLDILSKYSKILRYKNDGITFKQVAENISSCIEYSEPDYYENGVWNYNSFFNYVNESYEDAVDLEEKESQKAHNNFFAKYREKSGK